MRFPKWLRKTGECLRDMFEGAEEDADVAVVNAWEEPETGIEGGSGPRQVVRLGWRDVRALGIIDHIDAEYDSYRALCAEADRVSSRFTIGSLFRMEALCRELGRAEDALEAWGRLLGALMDVSVSVRANGDTLMIRSGSTLLHCVA